MVNPSAPGLFGVPSDPGVATSSQVYDTLGLPMNEASALAMQASGIRSTVTRVLADLDGAASTKDWLADMPLSSDGSVALDSAQAVFVVAAFNRAFGKKKKLIKLSNVSASNWSSLAGVVGVITAAINARRGVTV